MAKDANADLDAFESRALEDELPGIVTAFDRAAMRSHLQTALVGQEGQLKIQTCSLTAAILLDECVAIRYELGIEGLAGGVTPVLVTGRVLPDADRAVAYAEERLAPLVAQVGGREELSPFAVPVAVIEPLGMVVHAYPIDGELPTLAAATDPAVAARVMQDLLADTVWAGKVDSCRAEPVHYNRRHRCMLRYRLGLADGRHLVVYGKVAGDGAGADIPAVVEGLRSTLGGAGVALPECLGYREDLQLVVFTEVPGVPRVAQLLKARLRGEPSAAGLTVEDAVEVCGRIAAALHTSGLRLGERRPLEVELARLHANLVPIQRLSPDLARRLGRWLDLIEARAAAMPVMDLRQCHGDFSYTQLVFDGPDAGMVDFDNFCQAEPALDLGQFLAYLRYAGLKSRGTSAAERAGLTERLADRFTTAYVAAGGPAAALERVGLYEATNLVRMAEHAWANLKARRLDQIITALGERLSGDD